MLLAATPSGLVRVAFGIEGFDTVLEELSDRISPRILRAPARLDVAAHQLGDILRIEKLRMVVHDSGIDEAARAQYLESEEARRGVLRTLRIGIINRFISR